MPARTAAAPRAVTRPRRVIVGFDPSPTGLNALWCAVQQARLHAAVLFVVAVESSPAFAHRLAAPPAAADPLRPSVEIAVADALLLAVGDLPPGLDVRTGVTFGNPAQVLCSLADRPDDLLVLSAPRRDGWRRLAARVRRPRSRGRGQVLVATDPLTPPRSPGR
jgi:nucleotide-binding universal stress UspA family protein